MEGDFWNNNLLFYILSVISNAISTFSSTVVGYGFISGTIYINLNIPYFQQQLFKCLMEKILLQCGELFNLVCD